MKVYAVNMSSINESMDYVIAFDILNDYQKERLIKEIKKVDDIEVRFESFEEIEELITSRLDNIKCNAKVKRDKIESMEDEIEEEFKWKPNFIKNMNQKVRIMKSEINELEEELYKTQIESMKLSDVLEYFKRVNEFNEELKFNNKWLLKNLSCF